MGLTKLYIKNSVPLQEAIELVEGEDYFNEDGHCFEYLGNDEFNFIKQSPLHFGQKMTELEGEHVLKLFWVLSNKM